MNNKRILTAFKLLANSVRQVADRVNEIIDPTSRNRAHYLDLDKLDELLERGTCPVCLYSRTTNENGAWHCSSCNSTTCYQDVIR